MNFIRLVFFILGLLTIHCLAQTDTLKKFGSEFEEYPEIDRTLCDSCYLVHAKFDTLTFSYFMKRVYQPAMSNHKINAETKFFVKQLKDYLGCDSDECRKKTLPIRPVFKWKGHSVSDVRIIDPAQFIDSTMSWDYDISLTTSEKGKNYKIYYSNSSAIKSATINYVFPMTNCGEYIGSHFFPVFEGDALNTAFCSAQNLDLEYISDSCTNRLLSELNQCNNHCRGYCGDESKQISFARIKNLPNLYFTTDADPDELYPARSIVLNIDNQYALTIWKFGIGLDYCQCQ